MPAPTLGTVIVAAGVHFSLFSSGEQVEPLLFDRTDDEHPAQVINLERGPIPRVTTGIASLRVCAPVRSTPIGSMDPLRRNVDCVSIETSCWWIRTLDALRHRAVAAIARTAVGETTSRPPSVAL
jgi:hypothetical protein